MRIGRGRLRPAALLLGLLALPVPGGADTVAPRMVALMNGALKVAGPVGYCIDMGAIRGNERGVFLLLGSCAALNGGGAAPPRQSAVLTASVVTGAPSSAPLSDSFAQMAAFFASEAGRAALSRVGKAASVRVVEVQTSGEVMILRVADGSATSGGKPVEQDYWRAIFEAKGRIVTLSVLGLSDQPIGVAQKRALLESFVRAVRKANGLAG